LEEADDGLAMVLVRSVEDRVRDEDGRSLAPQSRRVFGRRSTTVEGSRETARCPLEEDSG
jgi:hypothetical protein